MSQPGKKMTSSKIIPTVARLALMALSILCCKLPVLISSRRSHLKKLPDTPKQTQTTNNTREVAQWAQA
ncbi:hypothetical protein BJX99DRAFT_239898 [Aspergillus californicus]